MIPKFIQSSQIPHKPGIYIYQDEKGEILYVGKAIDLYHRVASYFSGSVNSFKTKAMVERISGVETIIVESELEALILEANLIKKYLPPYNIRLTDDKDYLYIAITKEDFPRVITARKKEKIALKEYFGPFPSSTTVKNTLKQLRRIFPWCSSPVKSSLVSSLSSTSNEKRTTRFRPCFYYHLKLCPGACVGEISKEDYNKIINRFSKFMSGKKEELLSELTKEMEEKSQKQEYEEAQRIKKIITGIEYLTQSNRTSEYLANPNFLEEEKVSTLEALQKDLNLIDLPERIECYDISNISGKQSTGSLVVLTNGEIDKSQYRRFKIIITGKPNDYAMHAEMMRRRLKHKEWPLPQLFLIDGGRGQVRAVQGAILEHAQSHPELVSGSDEILNQVQNDTTKIPIYGIAKRFEWLYPPEGEVVKLPKRSLSIRLLQKIRDEAHRFAITYHRKLRSKAFLPNGV